VITRQLEAAEVLSKLSTMNKDPFLITKQLVITKQLKLYFNSSRLPTQLTDYSRAEMRESKNSIKKII
jgi:hypothetical protein